MTKGLGNLILYRDLPEEHLIRRMLSLAQAGADATAADAGAFAGELVELACRYGLSGNLWHMVLAYALANKENAFSRACEISDPPQGSLSDLARHDFAILRGILNLDMAVIGGEEVQAVFAAIIDFQAPARDAYQYNHRIRDRIEVLARSLAESADDEAFFAAVTAFYKEFGVGKFGLHKAFRITREPGQPADITPITCTEHVRFDQLIGYEAQKAKLIENTECFLKGLPANNVLLFGDAGTGKSSSIKAILNEYYDQGLRMIEVYKHQFQDLTVALNQAKNRNYRFILFMDDLSFEEFEVEYKYLKAVIEGDLERRPENVLIYATSNRRHLIKESFSDRPELSDDINNRDTLQEKVSLAARFGVTIYYGKPNKTQFKQIVRGLADEAGIRMPEEELFAEANKWELSHGGLSGRTAAQFVKYIQGREGTQ